MPGKQSRRPAGLKARGRALWVSIDSAFELRPDELVVLESASKTADLVAEIEAALVGEPLTVPGSMGQMREHPLLSELRQQRAGLARLLAQLKLPDDPGVVGGRTLAATLQARRAARARWDRPRGAAG